MGTKELIFADQKLVSKHTRFLRLFNVWLDSCTGIAYKAGTARFKIVPVCKELVTIDSGFKLNYLSVDYDNLNGVELDSSQNQYNVLLTKQEVLEHPAWNTAVEEDTELLKTYAGIIFSEKGNPEKLMGFYVRQNINHNELRALCVGGLGDSGANGDYFLDDVGRFVRVAPKGA